MKQRLSLLFLLVAGSLHTALTQNTTEDGENVATPIWSLTTKVDSMSSNLCGANFEDTNATGIYYINPNVLQGPQAGQDNTSGKTLQSGLAVTIQNANSATTNGTNTTSSSYGLWYNTNGANYTGDFALGYDVCGIVGLSLNYNTQLRGQDDDGTCSSALDSTCIADIASVAQQYANWLTTPNTIGPGSNLTNTSLPGLCNTLAASVRDNFPISCSYFFQDSVLDGLGWPLTSNGENYETVLNPNCTLNGTWESVVTLYNNDSQSVYTEWVEAVTPVLFVFMPVADFSTTQASTRISSSVAELACLHIDQINDGSYEPPAAPTPTPIAYNATISETPSSQPTAGVASNEGISGGTIAGAVVGSVVGVAACVGGLLFWLWRKKRAQNSSVVGPQDALVQEELNGGKAELPGESNRYELEGPRPRELEGKDSRHELEGPRPWELQGKDSRHQLPATEEEGGRDNRQWLDGTEVQREKVEDQEPVELP